VWSRCRAGCVFVCLTAAVCDADKQLLCEACNKDYGLRCQFHKPSRVHIWADVSNYQWSACARNLHCFAKWTHFAAWQCCHPCINIWSVMQPLHLNTKTVVVVSIHVSLWSVMQPLHLNTKTVIVVFIHPCGNCNKNISSPNKQKVAIMHRQEQC